jgi:hypothetical protein
MVPPAGVEPALLAELDFESSASTNSATGALGALLAQGQADGNRYAPPERGQTFDRVRQLSLNINVGCE